MSNPGEFLQACADGKVWLYCAGCEQVKNFNDVEHVDCIENPACWDPEPWWHDTRVFNCPVCNTQQKSKLEFQPG
ncbi:MAG: hypothetical protein C0619_12265 [Desulfuromonas sp.]|nr:MAG: hypothetical protein C0619_12265 [Desulfuromonas sp.]